MKKWIYYGLLAVFCCGFCIGAWQLTDYFLQSRSQAKVYDRLQDIMSQELPAVISTPLQEQTEDPFVTVTDPDGNARQVLRQFSQLYGLNSDIVGWLRIPGTNIDYPVMQSPREPDYYLTHNFEKDRSAHGCIYAREVSDIFAPSDNITLYGHFMKDGSMFAQLEKYKEKAFWEDCSMVELITLEDSRQYEIFSVFLTTATEGEGFAYQAFVDAADPDAFDRFVDSCLDLSLYATGVVPQWGDKLLTLSTCEYSQTNGRLVVVARQIP